MLNRLPNGHAGSSECGILDAIGNHGFTFPCVQYGTSNSFTSYINSVYMILNARLTLFFFCKTKWVALILYNVTTPRYFPLLNIFDDTLLSHAYSIRTRSMKIGDNMSQQIFTNFVQPFRHCNAEYVALILFHLDITSEKFINFLWSLH